MAEETMGRGEHTRDEIVESAHQLFLERGYHGTSMRQIAQRAGIALGGIYNHFSSKEDIFHAVLMKHHPYNVIIPAVNEARGDTAEELIRDAFQRMVTAMDGRLDFINLLFIELVEFKRQHVKEIIDLILPQVMPFALRVTAVQGNLKPIPLPMLLRSFMSLFFAYVLPEMMFADVMPPEMRHQPLEYLVDIFLHGVLDDTPKQEESNSEFTTDLSGS